MRRWFGVPSILLAICGACAEQPVGAATDGSTLVSPPGTPPPGTAPPGTTPLPAGERYCDALFAPALELWVDNESGSTTGTGSASDPMASIQQALDAASGPTHIHVQATATSYDGVCVMKDQVALLGSGGRPVVDGLVACDGRQSLLFSRADDVWFVGFRADTSASPGVSARALLFSGLVDAPIHRNYGCDIEAIGPGEGFPGRSLISSSLCYDCVLEDSSSTGAEEHGIYWTNHQDGSILRNNVVTDADGACLQLNADPETFSAGSAIEDGHMSDGLVEGNTLFDCGRRDGGAALNLAGVTHTVFRNNLIYGTNNPGGIAAWDDGYSDWGDPGNLGFGCTDNQFVHNTIDCRGCDRHAMSFRNGSTDNSFVNNIVITSDYDAIAYDPESASGLWVDHNVYEGAAFFEDPAEQWIDLAEWQALGHDASSLTSTVADLFVDAPGADFHPLKDGVAVDAGNDMAVTTDLDGNPRPVGAGPDIGAFELQ